MNGSVNFTKVNASKLNCFYIENEMLVPLFYCSKLNQFG